jgi:hypothetical protein
LAVLTSSIELFEKNIQGENFNLKLVSVRNSNEHIPPIKHPKIYKRNPENCIYLSAHNRYWAKYAYQFSHEYCHHLIESNFINTFDQFGWFEESLCELASIHSLKNMAQIWSKEPPFSNWKSYSTHLEEYAVNILTREANNIDYPLSIWLEENIEQLSKDRYQREKNCLVAANVSDIFFNDPTLWNSIAYIRKVLISKNMTFTNFMLQWGQLLPESNRQSWSLLKERLLDHNI